MIKDRFCPICGGWWVHHTEEGAAMCGKKYAIQRIHEEMAKID